MSDNFQAARKITKNYRSVTGYFQSRKNNRPIAFESILERNLFLTLEFEKDVEKYYEQPIKIALQIDNKKSIYENECEAFDIAVEKGHNPIRNIKFDIIESNI